MLEHGADPNKRYFFGSEINLVSDPEYLELLLTFGANPDSRDRSGMTPLMKAARFSQVNSELHKNNHPLIMIKINIHIYKCI